MSTKQFGIIFTLAGLVVCVGLLSIKLNAEGLKDPTDLATIADQKVDEVKEKALEEDFFYTARSEREQKDAEVVANLKAAVADKNTSAEVKKSANTELLNKTKQTDYENRISSSIKNKGFKDVLCYIEGDKAKIYVKGDTLSQEKSREIKEVVQDVSGITNLSIEVKK